ncbi:MAG: hypothetical protein H6729_07475 [Deltaproteobacteria bacterium]|nr:hypothetical protein [Deltaproteobacteria bacterium]
MRVMTFQGSVTDIGQAFGEACREDIRALYEARVANAIDQVKTHGAGRMATEASVLDVARQSVPWLARCYPRVFSELEGIARGSGLSTEQAWALNNLTDLRDVLAYGAPDEGGCSAFVLPPGASASGSVLLGQTWDLATDNMPYVLVVDRRPDDAPRTVSMTLVGCLSLIGLNERGLAIGTTNLRATDARPGLGYLDLIHQSLTHSVVEDAVAVIEGGPRAAAHFYYLADAHDHRALVECTATRSRRLSATHDLAATRDAAIQDVAPRSRIAPDDWAQMPAVHCNHVLSDDLCSIEAETPPGSSRSRQTRLSALLTASARVGGGVTVEDLKAALSDHEGGPNAICRHDLNGISSNASVIMEPKARCLYAVQGPACSGRWIEVRL